MREIHRMVRGDTGPAIFETLYDAEGKEVDLSGSSVRFLLVDMDGVLVVDGVAELINGGVLGGVKFDAWTTTHTGTAGNFRREWEVTFPSTRIESWPKEDRVYDVVIRGDAG